MKIQIKKVIAREILILLGLILTSLLSFLATFPYNSRINKRVIQIDNTIWILNIEKDSLENTYSDKLYNQENFFNQVSKEFDFEKFNVTTFWIRTVDLLNKDSLKYRTFGNNDFKNYLIRIGYKDFEYLASFIRSNTLTEIDKNNRIRVDEIDKELGMVKVYALFDSESYISWIYQHFS